MSIIRYWVWLSGLYGLRPAAKHRLLAHFGGPQEIYFADDYAEVEGLGSEARRLLEESKSLERADVILERCQRQNVQILTCQDAAYPRRLTHIYDPPAVLYIKGRMPWVDEQCAVAIVGTRKATPYGIKMGRKLGYELTAAGALVISGLAAGVDTAGAVGALRAGGSCVGVLGTAIDVVYPNCNRALFEDVAAVGALLSEYPPGAPGSRHYFPLRNRIMAGLSCGVTVIEAPARSGALITAARAAEFGRDVFAVPGNADAPNCQGSNALIRDGAKAVSCAWDILSEYSGRFPSLRAVHGTGVAFSQPIKPPCPAVPVHTPEAAEDGARDAIQMRRSAVGQAREEARRQRLEQQLEQLSQTQLKLLSAIPSPETQVDEIIQTTGLPTAVVLAELTVLQIKGYVSQSKGKRFSLNIRLPR